MPGQGPKKYRIERSINNGIERISYFPEDRRFATPILMQHGMWHGAWCWQQWQELFAEWGWESHAISLPGHGGSPVQHPIRWCTLDYYLRFLKAEVDRLPAKPVLMGHSMGGAIAQWYLKYVGGELPAVVMVASWVSRYAVAESVVPWFRLDPIGILLASLTLSATPYIRNPERAAEKLISAGSVYSPEELYAKLGPESLLVTMQHNPPFWSPAKHINAPMLWLAGEIDAVVGLESERRSAADYGADFVVIPNAAHNLMLEHNYHETAAIVHRWLENRAVK